MESAHEPPSPPMTATLAPDERRGEHPRPARPSRAFRWAARFIALAILAVAALMFLGLAGLGDLVSVGGDDSIHEQYHSLDRHATQKVAIILVEGAILDGDGFVKKQIDKIRKDDDVKAVVLRVNSPGGTVTASDYLYHHLTRLTAERKLPLVVSMGGIAASGGYYVSMAVGDTPESIFAEPTTWTGSIGVVIPHYNVAGLMEQWNVEEDSIKSHRLKQMGSPTRPMTEEERQIFQALVNDSFDRFKQIVKAGRPAFRNDEQALTKVATGQVFTTRQALDNGLVDKEGFIEEAIERAIALAGLDKDKTKAVKYKRSGGLVDLFLSTAHSRSTPPSGVSQLAAILELTAPRAYYLCTWLPPLAVGGED
ncbi:MAG TPA: signal peptide peptidase SppA [Pirellulales bacterium]|nr:signal peptide peptidase SppA [Pirellulales bacterium]